MREVTAFAGLQKLLLDEERPEDALADLGTSSEERIAFLCHDLLALGAALRSELPEPGRFVEIAAVAATEAALVAARPGTAPPAAIDRLTAHQRDRLESHPGGEVWKARGPETHLARAFWQLAGMAREIAVSPPRDGQLEEHAADLVNYLLFAVLGSGAWDLAVRQTRPRAGGLPGGRLVRPFLPPPPSPPGPGEHPHPERRPTMKPNHPETQPQQALPTRTLSPLAEEALEQVEGGGWRFLKDFEPPPVTPTVG